MGERGWGEGPRSRDLHPPRDCAHVHDDALFDGLAGWIFLLTHGAARRGGILSLLVQRKNQRNTPQAARPALRSGSASGPGISVRHIPVPYGNAVIHDGALRVLPDPLAVPHGGPEKQEQQQQQIADAFAFAPGAP